MLHVGECFLLLLISRFGEKRNSLLACLCRQTSPTPWSKSRRRRYTEGREASIEENAWIRETSVTKAW